MRFSDLSLSGLADRFGVRLGLILTLALAPVGILAIVRSAGIDSEVRARTEAALAGQTLRAAAPVLDQLSRAKGLASGVASAVVAVMTDTPDDLDDAVCLRLMQAVADDDHSITVAALYDENGQLNCGLPGSPSQVWPSDAVQTAVVEGIEVPLVVMPAGPPQGPATAHVAVALRPADTALPPPGSDPDSIDASMTLMLFDAAGNVLTTNVPNTEIWQYLPRYQDLTRLGETPAHMFASPSNDGKGRIYSLNPLIPDRVYALGSWPDQRNPVEVVNAMSPLIVPAATWAVCLLAAWLAAELMVTRHMRRFRRAIAAFSRGNRKIDPLDLRQAPSEIRQAAEAFSQMTDTIMRDEAELEDALRQREALLREVHHRVKNNLQLMASILNLQIRRTRSDEAKKIMRRLQDRMLSLATVHNSLFHTASLTEVQADRLFLGIVDQVIVANASQGQPPEIEAEFAPLLMSPEQIVPLALLLTEALGRAIRSGSQGAADQIARIRVILRHEDDASITLTVTHHLAEPDLRESDDIALGSQLIHAFAMQLGGTYRFDRQGEDEVQSLNFRLTQHSTAAG